MSADDPAVRFVGGSTGPEVRVCTTGAAETNARIGLQFGDALSAQPSFGVKVVEPRRVRVYIVPVVQYPEDEPQAVRESELAHLKESYAQCGISFSVVSAEKVIYDRVAFIEVGNPSSRAGLEEKAPYLDGVVVFVSSYPILGAAGYAFGRGRGKLIIGSRRGVDTLAHEMGHALGLQDIYINSKESPYGRNLNNVLIIDFKTSRACFGEELDWNGGDGTRFYGHGTDHAGLIARLQMYGNGFKIRRDIPQSAVLGVTLGKNGFRILQTSVGLDGIEIAPRWLVGQEE